MKKSILSELAPQPLGPYSQAIAVGSWLFLSGQIPMIPETGEVISGDITAQTERVMKNIKEILHAHQMDFQHIVKVGIFLKNMEHFSAVNAIYGKYFQEPFPARFCVEVSELPKRVDIEIEATAFSTPSTS